MSNQVTLVGLISSEFTYDHSIYGEDYYRVTVSVERTSGYTDNIPVIISERLVNTKESLKYCSVAVSGQFRSYKSDGRLILFVFATEWEIVEHYNINDVLIEGVIFKTPNYRLTPYGREITDLLLQVPRAYYKHDYIPCICWGRTAKYTSALSEGSIISVAGRIQSRYYDKDGETKTAYELSVNLVEVVADRPIGMEVACRG